MFQLENAEKLCNIVLINILLILIFGQIFYIVFGVIYLIEYYDIWNNCQNTSLWIYALISIIIEHLLFSSFTIVSIKKENNRNFTNNIILLICPICLCIIEFFLAVWGRYELFDRVHNCSDLINSKLWIFSLVSFIIQIIISGIFILLIIFNIVLFEIVSRILIFFRECFLYYSNPIFRLKPFTFPYLYIIKSSIFTKLSFFNCFII